MGTSQMFIAPESLYTQNIYVGGNFFRHWGPSELAPVLPNKGLLSIALWDSSIQAGLLLLFNPNWYFSSHEKKYFGVKNHKIERKWKISKMS